MTEPSEPMPSLPGPQTISGSDHKYKTHKCEKCGLGFRTITDLRLHSFSGARNSQICSECDQIFSSVKGMRQHFGKMHAKLKPARCHICKKRYRNKYALKFHIQQVHERSARDYCPRCSLEMYNSYSVKRHLKICKGIEESLEA
jgi:KRAB domain-containing zinc finger protein